MSSATRRNPSATQAPAAPSTPSPGSRGTARAFVLGRVAPLNPAHAVPLYMQLAERFVALITQGQDALVGQSLPTESECMAHFGISRPTVRQAMAHLANLGLITRGRGRGRESDQARRRRRHELIDAGALADGGHPAATWATRSL